MTILSIFHGGILNNYENITSFATSDNGLAPSLSYIGVRTRVKFGGQRLKQEKVTFTQWNVVNIYIVYEKDFGHLNRVITSCYEVFFVAC